MSYRRFLDIVRFQKQKIKEYLQVTVFAPINVIVSPIPMLIDLKELDVITPARSIRKVQGSAFPLFLIILAANGGKAIIILKENFTRPHQKLQKHKNLYPHSL